eukprot:gb/GECG01001890.1/.p1 GENE.gb/GECG01001890.1/~~gb/GECG01001890.1/.p1  ORF type:complete len:142 (+),score=16.97 gb/GECG01001890.1/:1-426(+)
MVSAGTPGAFWDLPEQDTLVPERTHRLHLEVFLGTPGDERADVNKSNFLVLDSAYSARKSSFHAELEPQPELASNSPRIAEIQSDILIFDFLEKLVDRSAACCEVDCGHETVISRRYGAAIRYTEAEQKLPCRTLVLSSTY